MLPPAGAAGAHRRAADQRRGLRAHGLRRRSQHQSAARYPGLAARAFIVSSFGKTYHVTGWKVGYRGRAGRADGRVPQGAPVQRVHRQHADAARPGRLHGRPRALPATCRPSTSASATCSAPAWPTPASSCCPAKAATSSAWTSRPGRAERDLPEADFCQWLTSRDRRGRHSAVGLLRQRLRPESHPLLLRQEGRDPERGAATPRATLRPLR